MELKVSFSVRPPPMYERWTDFGGRDQQVTGKVRQGVMTIVTEGEWPEARL